MSNPQSNGINLSDYPLIQKSFSQNSVNQAPEVFEEEEEELDLRQISKVIGNILGFNLISANNANFYVIGEIFIVENGRSLSI